MKKWGIYYEEHKNREPREQLVRAVSYCPEKHLALDLGAGTLSESTYLLKSGFEKVIAVDKSPQVRSFAEKKDSNRFELIVSTFQDFDFSENRFDLINAQHSLPFYGPEGFSIFIERIIQSLKSNGVFVGQFFGVKDGWNTADSRLVFHTKEEVGQLLSQLEIIELTEEEKDGGTVLEGRKHWHLFNFIAKKVLPQSTIVIE